MKLTVTLNEAPSDVLFILDDLDSPITRDRICELVRERHPETAADPETDREVEHALRLLRELGFIAFTGGADLGPLAWAITPEGRRAIERARSGGEATA
jgi:hypothetical protein